MGNAHSLLLLSQQVSLFQEVKLFGSVAEYEVSEAVVPHHEIVSCGEDSGNSTFGFARETIASGGRYHIKSLFEESVFASLRPLRFHPCTPLDGSYHSIPISTLIQVKYKWTRHVF